MNAREALKVYFGFDSFKEGQEEIINAILSARDVLGIMPTGAGKSICYQIPAVLLSGVTIVISPLISLMQDQVASLNSAGINAAFINSSLTETQINGVYDNIKKGGHKLLYVAPERLSNQSFLDFIKKIEVSLVCVDESHCISQWGQDFRPSYLKIVDFVNSLPTRPTVSAFTATATKEVKNDICCMLNLQNPKVVTTGFDRKNLYFEVLNLKNKNDYIINYIKTHLNESGIIYCATRKSADDLSDLLLKSNVKITKYHGGMSNDLRRENQNDFIYDRCHVIIATNAFGMGINKSNVHYVIHYNMPQSMENYYQEAGRAGRDGEEARCILLFSPQDIAINKFLLEHKEFVDIQPEDINLIKERDIKRLQIMERYCKTTSCLRNYILKYFGEKPILDCKNCGNCDKEYIEIDMTEDAKKVINCIWEAKSRYGINIILGTLLGANRARLKELGTINYKSYGTLRHHKEDMLRLLLNQMIADGYIYQTAEEYSVIRIRDFEPLRNENTRVIVKVHKEQEKKQEGLKQTIKSKDALTKAGYDLFEVLRNLRLEIAREESIPPYIVFSDKTLIAMSAASPSDKASMLQISGVGEVKFERYGEKFIQAILKFKEHNPGKQTSITSDNLH